MTATGCSAADILCDRILGRKGVKAMRNTGFFGYSVELDDSMTRDWYAHAGEWDCECAHCQNFLEQARRKKLPESVLEALDELGIEPEKATYVCALNTDKTSVLYQFSYRIAGTILANAGADDWKIGRCCHEVYPHGAPGFPEPHFDLEFCTSLPWVLEGSPDE